MASVGDYPAVLNLTPNLQAALEPRGYDIPTWLCFGWIWTESAGVVGDTDTSNPDLGGEYGLFQLSAEERANTGFTDLARMTSPDDADYQIAAGFALIDLYGGKVAAASGGAIGADAGELYWKLVKFCHGAGEPAMRLQVSRFIKANGSAPASWSDFADFSTANPVTVKGTPKQAFTDHYLAQADSVYRNGLVMAGMSTLVPPSLGGAGGVGGWIPVVAALGLLGAALYAVKG